MGHVFSEGKHQYLYNRIQQLIHTPHIPEKLLHTYAYGCALHALTFNIINGRRPAYESFDLLEAKQRWIADPSPQHAEEVVEALGYAVSGLYYGSPFHAGAAALAAGWIPNLPESLLDRPIDEGYVETTLRAPSLLAAVEDMLYEARKAVSDAADKAAMKRGVDSQPAITPVEEEMLWQLGYLEDLIQNPVNETPLSVRGETSLQSYWGRIAAHPTPHPLHAAPTAIFVDRQALHQQYLKPLVSIDIGPLFSLPSKRIHAFSFTSRLRLVFQQHGHQCSLLVAYDLADPPTMRARTFEEIFEAEAAAEGDRTVVDIERPTGYMELIPVALPPRHQDREQQMIWYEQTTASLRDCYPDLREQADDWDSPLFGGEPLWLHQDATPFDDDAPYYFVGQIRIRKSGPYAVSMLYLFYCPKYDTVMQFLQSA